MRRPEPPRLPGPPEVVVLELPAATADRPPLLHLAAAADPWPGAMAVWRSRDGASFALVDALPLPALVGRTSSELPPGPVWRWDERTRLEVTLSRGGLASIGRAAALEGGNMLAILGPDGRAELLCAAEAELFGAASYRLSGLLRGLGGTEDEAARAVPAGATCVVLDEAVRPLVSSPDEIGRPALYRIGPAGRDHSDPSYIQREIAPGVRALEPLAPVHVRAVRVAEGVRVTWIRRARGEADNWNVVETPLGEEREAYELQILSGGLPLRTLTVSAPSTLYPAAEEIADFGTPQTEIALRVAQSSAVAGRGRAAALTLPIL